MCFRPTKLGPGPLGPFFCNNTWHFDFADLAPIRNELDIKWTNIENGTAEDSLWKHEWQKHGTCAAQLEPLDSELNYFSKGIEFFDLHDMSGILAQSGIVPTSSKTYNVQEISDAVKSVIDKNVGVECWIDPVSLTQNCGVKKLCLRGIYFCYRKPKLTTYLKSGSATIKIWLSLTVTGSGRAQAASAI
jgi:ribonuclease I